MEEATASGTCKQGNVAGWAEKATPSAKTCRLTHWVDVVWNWWTLKLAQHVGSEGKI